MIRKWSAENGQELHSKLNYLITTVAKHVVQNSRGCYYSISEPFVYEHQIFPFINRLEMLRCATNQDMLLLYCMGLPQSVTTFQIC